MLGVFLLAMSAMLSLQFEKVSKSFAAAGQNPKVVVNDLSFAVKKGEFFSILGPSGCGKTTCLRMISGLEKPTSGIIKMSDQIVNDIHPHKRNVHTVFQKYALFPHLNVFENVAFGLRMKKQPQSEIKARVERMLQMVHLEDYATRSIQQLSGGEQQRVALIRALVNEPAILLLDEPLAALDLKLREQMQQELSALQKQLGTTFIFVTHDQGEALTLSDRVAIMNQGKIEQIGTPTEVYEQPATAFVAKFVGTTNVFTGTVSQTDTSANIYAITTDGYGVLYVKADETRGPRPATNSIVGVVVRPEKIRVRVTAPVSGALGDVATSVNVLRGTLIERIYFGPTTQIKLQISDRLPPIIALVANQTATKMPQLKVGEKYYAVWDASDSILATAT